MKGILLLLCLIGTTLAAITKLNTGLYSYTSDLVVSGSPVSISASAVVSFVERDEAAQSTTFALRVGGVLVITGEDKIYKDDQVYALPFQFVRTDAGQIVSVKVHPNEFLEAANLKKSIAESFQTSTLEHNDHVVTETGANGVRNAHYKVIHSDSQSIGIRGTYSERDFVSFPSLSGMENGGFSISSKKVSTINPRDNNFKMAMITTEIAKAEEMTTLLKTRIEFTSSEVAMIDMIDEADWKVESLMHEIDPLNRKNVLKTTLPSVETLMAQISNDPSSTKEILKARSQLVTLANNCKKSAKKIVAQLGEMLQSETANSARIYNILARINSEEAQLLLSNEIASAAKDAKKLRSIFNALVALNNPSAPEILTMTLLNLEVPKESKELYELTVGNVAKFLHPAEAEYVLAPFVKELETAEGSRKIQLLHTLGNAGANAPADLIVSYLSDTQIPVRGAALANLRNFLHLEKVQQQVMNALKQKENIESKPFVSSLLTSLKESTKKNSLSSNFAEFLNQLAIGAQLEDLSQFLKEKNMFAHQSLQTPIDVKSSTNIWNDTSDPNYNLVSPAAQRQRDVDTYPIYTAQLMARQLGPRPTNLKAAAGVFSGSDGSCLADNFKIFDKLLIETNILGEKTILADVQLYVYTFDNAFESRIYAVINGNTLIDFELTADNCTAEEFIIFDGELEIFNNQTEIPIDMGTVLIYGSALAHLEFDAGYIVCLTSSYLELYIVGKTDIIVDVGVTITALGVVRVGVEFDVYADYILGPDTHIGSPSNATIPKFTGQLAQKQAKLTKEIRTCETCIGIYYGHSDQIAYLGLFIQRREGLGWGDPVKIPIIESVTPGVPFPEPIIETCDNWEFPTLAPMA